MSKNKKSPAADANVDASPLDFVVWYSVVPFSDVCKADSGVRQADISASGGPSPLAVILYRLFNRLCMWNSFMDAFRFGHKYRSTRGSQTRSVVIGIDLGELGSQEENLSGIVDPCQ